jgi:drug/metabolite transporter (DMT)-like permease
MNLGDQNPSSAISLPLLGTPRIRFLATIGLATATLMWGSSFFLTKESLAVVPVFYFQAIRHLISFLSFLPFVIPLFTQRKKILTPIMIRGVLITGLISFFMINFQSIGLSMLPSGITAFIFALYVPVTPFLAVLFLKAKILVNHWISVVLAAVGMVILVLRPDDLGNLSFQWNIGMILLIFSAIFAAGQIVATERFVQHVHIPTYIFLQLFVVTVLCFLTSFLVGENTPLNPQNPGSPVIYESRLWMVWIYLALFSITIPAFMQNWAQKYIDSTRAAVIYALEPVFATTFAVIFAAEELTLPFLIGAGMIFTGLIVANWPKKK